MRGVLRTKHPFARTSSSAIYVRRARLYAYSGLDLGRSAEEKILSPRAFLLSTSIAVRHLVHINLARVDARFIASCPPSSLRAHLISISCFPMDQNEPAMSEDDESMTLASEGQTNTPKDSEADLIDKIQSAREALASSPPDHPDRAERVAWLGYHLYMCYGHTGDISIINEAIHLNREALALRPPGHPDRANSCVNLGYLLDVRYQQTGNVALLDEAIELLREALALRPPGHPSRSSSCANLGVLLHVRYKQTGNVALLNEAIELEREALALRPPGHPDRANSCVNLGSLLDVRYQQTGNVALLDEAIELLREALALQFPGHPNRAHSCASLGLSLCVRYQQTGDIALLDEAIELLREALSLRPPGHPDREISCGNLAASLHVRYQQTGDVALLNEAIELQREALALQTPGAAGHLDRAISCVNLAALLHAYYQQTGNVALLDETIDLTREALALQPPGHPDRANSCVNLGYLLDVRYEQTSDVALLDEAIKLQREALALQPLGHPDRAHSCVNLGYSLHLRYKQTGDVVSLDQAIEACIHASEHSSASGVWRPLTQLSALHLFCDSPHYSVLKALEYLQQSFQHEVDNIYAFISEVCYDAALTWDNSGVWTPPITALLVKLYAKIVDRLPLVANFVLNTSSRLRSLKSTRRVGSDACVAALLAEQPATAVSLLDRAHGVVWTQALHQRDPQMEGAPKDLAIELEDLLRAISTSTPVDPARLPDHPQDLRHRQNTRIQAILREIRAMPGLARFMLGSTYETLRDAACSHPVVVLVAAHDHAFALIMPSSSYASPDILRLNVASHTLQSFANSVGQANLRCRAGSAEHCEDVSSEDVNLTESIKRERAMRNGNFGSEWSPQ
jgi:tetratricopeptide (TPR) repeat protein